MNKTKEFLPFHMVPFSKKETDLPRRWSRNPTKKSAAQSLLGAATRIKVTQHEVDKKKNVADLNISLLRVNLFWWIFLSSDQRNSTASGVESGLLTPSHYRSHFIHFIHWVVIQCVHGWVRLLCPVGHSEVSSGSSGLRMRWFVPGRSSWRKKIKVFL